MIKAIRLRGACALALRGGVAALALSVAACGDDADKADTNDNGSVGANNGEANDNNSNNSANEDDAGMEPEADAGSEPEPEKPIVVGDGTPQIVAVSADGHDRFYGVTFDKDGNIYAVGQMAATTAPDADYSLMVAKLSKDGALDTAFGSGGIATFNATANGKAGPSGENARGIVIQSTGKIVIAGTAEHDVTAEGILANDTDIVIVRFNADGTPDTSFGDQGLIRHDLNSGVASMNSMGTPTVAGADAQWSLGLTSDDKLVVHCAQRGVGDKADASGPRTDSDWALLRLKADGTLDDTFGTIGKVTLDIGEAGAAARSATVLADGSIIGAGYTTTDILNPGTSTQQPVLYKVTSAGMFDPTFGVEDAWSAPGVYYDYTVAPPARAEAYGAAAQGDKLVTMGYGPTQAAFGTGADWVSFRFTGDGKLDPTYGNNGVVWLDAGTYGDNGRAVFVLPDLRIVGLGGGRPTPATPPEMGTNPPVDAMIALLDENGAPDTSFGAGGMRLYDFGGTNDFFWAGAVSPDKTQMVAVGIKGVAAGTGNDDAALLIIPLD